jgi:hypothetical protein
LRDAENALVVVQRMQGGKPHSLRTGQVWLLLAKLKADAGDSFGARAAARSALEHFSQMLEQTHADLQAARRLASE